MNAVTKKKTNELLRLALDLYTYCVGVDSLSRTKSAANEIIETLEALEYNGKTTV